MLVVEHSLDVIKTADWVIDLGPDGGAGGGRIVAAGTPEEVAACDESHTGRALRDVLPAYEHAPRAAPAPRPAAPPKKTPPIVVRGASQHNLQNVDLTLPRGKTIVFAGPSGSGKFAGDGHPLRRGPAAVRREPLQLRPAVPGPDAQAAGRFRHRVVAGGRHRTEDRRQHPAARWGRSRRSTTISAFYSPGSARRTARRAARRWGPAPPTRSSPACWGWASSSGTAPPPKRCCSPRRRFIRGRPTRNCSSD